MIRYIMVYVYFSCQVGAKVAFYLSEYEENASRSYTQQTV